jgi:dihydropteroate synthase
MQSLTEYDDVVADVVEYFRRFSDKAVRQGIKSWILDPGFGFAKSLEQNYEMLIRLAEFKSLQVPVLVGVSRKSMIYRLLDITPEEALPATQVLHMKALQSGADILRVHDVAEIVRTVALYRILG